MPAETTDWSQASTTAGKSIPHADASDDGTLRQEAVAISDGNRGDKIPTSEIVDPDHDVTMKSPKKIPVDDAANAIE